MMVYPLSIRKIPKISFDEYISNPNKPVPFTNQISTRMTREYMVADQRFAAQRPDVLVYKSDELKKDVTIAGPIIVKLYVSTSGTDADWVVKLIDVYPDTAKNNEPNPCNIKMGGYQMMVRGDVMRGKYRNSYSKPEPFVPNKVTEINFTMPDIYHTFLKGHRIMVQIQSSWFPMVDRNPQKFENIYFAKDSDFQSAVQKVFHSKNYPSSLIVNIIQ